MPDNDILIKLRENIKNELSHVTAANSPNIYAEIQSARGYAAVEQEIIQRMLNTQLQPAAIIPQLEQESEMM